MSSIIFVALKGQGTKDPDKYVAWIHDNIFVSNHWFITSKGNRKNTIESNDPNAQQFNARIENNKFIMVDEPVKIDGRRAFNKVSESLAGKIVKGGNTSNGEELAGTTFNKRRKLKPIR